MADYVSTPINVGTGPAGTDGDTTRASFLKAIADFAQIFAGLTFDSTTNALELADDLTVPSGTIVVGSPTGGDKGTGTINATAVYDDNVLLSDYIFEKYVTGAITDDHDKAKGFSPDAFNLDLYANFWRTNLHLIGLPSREAFEENGLSIGELAQALWETVEVQAIHIEKLHQRLSNVESMVKPMLQVTHER